MLLPCCCQVASGLGEMARAMPRSFQGSCQVKLWPWVAKLGDTSCLVALASLPGCSGIAPEVQSRLEADAQQSDGY